MTTAQFMTLVMCVTLSFHAPNRPQGTAVQRSQIEWIHLVTSGSFFVTPEKLRFSIAVRQGYENAPSLMSTVAYVELIGENGKAAVRTKVLLKGGQGDGQLMLTSSLPTGNYTLLSYTRWMRNFSSSLFFRKKITVVNPGIPALLSDSISRDRVDVTFFPEGGNLISGIPVKVAYRMNGNIKITGGRVLNDSGELLTPLTVLSPSTGFFIVTPKPDESIKVAFTSGDSVVMRDVPNSRPRGLGLRLTEDSEMIVIELSHFKSQRPVRHCRLRSRGSVLPDSLFRSERNEKEDRIFLSKETLPVGEFLFEVTDSANTVLAFRRFRVSRNDRASITVRPLRKAFGTREPAQLEIKNLDSTLLHLTVSIRLAHANEGSDIEHTGLGRINDDLIIGYPADMRDPRSVAYLPDLRGQLISARMLRSGSGEAIPGREVFLSARSSGCNFYVTRTDSSGRMHWNVSQIPDPSGLWLTTRDSSDNFLIKYDNEFIEGTENFTPLRIELDSTLKSEIQKRSIYNQIENAYTADDADTQTVDTNKFYARADKTYKLDDYARFPTMEDIFREYIAEIVVRKRKDNYSIVLVNPQSGFRYTNEPLVLIDGLPVFNVNELMAYDPLLVKSIDIVNSRYVYSSLETDGIVSLHTFKGTAPGLDLSRFTNLGYNLLMQAQDCSRGVSVQPRNVRIPDYRTQLYCNTLPPFAGPLVIDFLTSDVEGRFVCEVTALNAKGEVVYARESFQVGRGSD